ncbi:MAG: ATP-dependent Clp protease proteolytic subunit [Planctomycetota bacterium]
MAKVTTEHETQKEETGVHYLFGPVDTGKAQAVCEHIIKANVESDVPHIQLIINSPGGSVDAGFAIIDIMEWSRLPVYTTGIGMIASMGLLIFMAGEKGHRVVTPRTSILSHRFSAWAVGNHSELVAGRKEQDLVHCRIVNHYLQHTNLKTEADLTRTILRDVDTWLTLEEAVRHGIADIVQPDRKRPYPDVVTRDLARTLASEKEG